MTITRRDFSRFIVTSGAASILSEKGWPSVSPRTSGEASDHRRYDLLIKGGTVVDPSQGLHTILDVAVTGGKIAALAMDIPESLSARVVSAKGRIVTPGFIDSAVHCCESIIRVSINADHYCLGRGVTTVVESGGVGAQGLPGAVKYIIDPSTTRIFVALNIFPPGYAYRAGVAEWDDVDAMDPDLAAKTGEENKPVVVAIKCYLEKAHVGTRDFDSLTRALEAAEMSHLPLVADINDSYSPLPMIVNMLRKGDVFAHFYSNHPNGILDANGKILPEVRAARDRGVSFDTGGGYGQVSFKIIEKAFEQGFLPDTISTDLMVGNVDRVVFDLPTEVSKFMALGMDLDKAIECVTAGPAKLLDYGIQIGTLRPGSEADISIFELHDEKFEFAGSDPLEKRVGRHRLINKAVVCRGKFFVNSV